MDLVNASQSVCTEDFKHLQWFKDKILRLEVPYTALRFTLEMGGSRQWFLCRPVCAVLDRLLKKIQPGAKGNRAEVLAIRSETELFGARLFSATA